RPVRRHHRLEIGVLGFEISKYVLVSDFRVPRVLDPGIRVFDGDAVHGEAVAALLGDGGLGCGHCLPIAFGPSLSKPRSLFYSPILSPTPEPKRSPFRCLPIKTASQHSANN